MGHFRASLGFMEFRTKKTWKEIAWGRAGTGREKPKGCRVHNVASANRIIARPYIIVLAHAVRSNFGANGSHTVALFQALPVEREREAWRIVRDIVPSGNRWSSARHFERLLYPWLSVSLNLDW